MTSVRLDYVHRFRDRHGRLRHYYRRHGRRVPLPGVPGSAEFMAAYADAAAGTPPKPAASRIKPGSIDALAVAYYQSAEFRTLAASTQKTFRGIVERLRAEHGDKPVKLLETRHIRRIIAAKSDRPPAANNLLKVLRALMRFAVNDGWRAEDPTNGVKKLKEKGPGIHTWTEAEIGLFEAAYPIGSRERLALALLLYTGARRADVVGLGWQHVQAGVLRFRQQKTGGEVEIPVVAELAAVLDGTPRDHLTFLVTAEGRPFSPVGFYNWFTARARAAGLPKGCSPHGLRKAIARRLAEGGATASQMAAVTGHTTLAEVERYSRDANRRRLAKDGMAVLEPKREQ